MAVGVPVGTGKALPTFISTGISFLTGCFVVRWERAAGPCGLLTVVTGELEETGETMGDKELEEAGGGLTGLKNGRERLPHPGMLTSQPEETISKSNNIAEKMDRLFKVSRNRVPRNAMCISIVRGQPVSTT